MVSFNSSPSSAKIFLRPLSESLSYPDKRDKEAARISFRSSYFTHDRSSGILDYSDIFFVVVINTDAHKARGRDKSSREMRKDGKENFYSAHAVHAVLPYT